MRFAVMGEGAEFFFFSNFWQNHKIEVQLSNLVPR